MKTLIFATFVTLAASTSKAADFNYRCAISGKNIATKTALVQLSNPDAESPSDWEGQAKINGLTVRLHVYSYKTQIDLYHTCGFLGMGCLFGNGETVGIPTGQDYKLILDVNDEAKNETVGVSEVTLKRASSKDSISTEGSFTPAGKQDAVKVSVRCERI